MPLIVAIQGERGSFSEAAARVLAGEHAATLSFATFDETFNAVATGAATAAVVPIENTLAGSIFRNYELLGDADLEIAGEVLLRIEHHLLASPGTALSDVRRILSHPVALAQCQKFLLRANAQAVATHDTAGSVRLMMEAGQEGDAAIAGAAAADVYGAAVIASNIEDHAENYTRFLLLAPRGVAPELRAAVGGGPLKTTVLFRTANRPGALFRALAAFALRDLNLTKLESRPIAGRPWEYSFYADIGGGADEVPVANALNHLREMCESVIVLGSYATAPAAASGVSPGRDFSNIG